MSRHLELKLISGIGSTPPPALGEEAGKELRRVAEQNENWAQMHSGYHRFHFLNLAIVFYDLAADAFGIASGCTIGHKRGERYDQQEEVLRSKAETLRKQLGEGSQTDNSAGCLPARPA